ncbi:MAG: alanine--tRNA ligase [Pyrinomonadaceae bacterium]|nr:alanine--tRNA ligase [Blastocatellia bacterium]MCW5956344.1 alanine--tRNA ligase [Pyrinomonadaceae bacterium]
MSVYEGLSDSQQFACRVIADHARSTAFAIADGILPGNEGRNYVLRKIMRRAIYHGREHLGLKDAFFYKVCDRVVVEMRGAYPELETQRDFIGKMVRLEEERFGNTVTVGLGKLSELEIDAAKPVDALFTQVARLYDTFGTPKDLIRVYLEEKGLEFEEDDYNERFETALQDLQKQSGIGQTQRKSEINPMYAQIAEAVGANKFHGYETTRLDKTEVAALVKGEEQVDKLSEGEEGLIVLKDTPFYAESGGQVGDVGSLSNSGVQVRVLDTFAPIPGVILHKSRIERGEIKAGDEIAAVVDSQKRDATRRNHTATHLVHAALKEVLGTHVKQAGSVVAPNYLRFDFTHYQPMQDTEIQEVEDLVNRYILQNEPVTTNMMALEDAMRSGAVAMFGEKYGAEVRVLKVGDGNFSMELCGGTHVRATGDIGSFKITSDEAIASGVRRIRAITGFDAFARFREDEVLIDRSLDVLKTQRDQLPVAIERLQDELKRTRREMDELKLKIATGAIGGASSNGDDAREIAGVKVIGKIVEGLDANGMRQLSDTLLARLKSGVVVIGRKEEGKAGIIVRVSDDLTARVKAGNVIKEIVPIVGGKGGGRPDMAEGGGAEPDKLKLAIDASYKVIETFLAT